MKIIFLDIDGVLNCENWYKKRFIQEIDRNMDSYPLCEFYPLAVDQLNVLTKKTNAEIVVSSTWRIGRTVAELNSIFKQVGIEKDILDFTPSLRGMPRGVEIKKWIDTYCIQDTDRLFNKKGGIKLESYVILDDDSDMLLEQKDNFIKTSWQDGLTAIQVNKAIYILNNETNRTKRT